MIALMQLFDSFFVDQEIVFVISDCFSTNQRCIRLLQKLDYKPIGIDPFERLQILMISHCWHWIRRFQLTAETWHARLQSTGD
jgi:RimJ/RimL family protein N-acetyltransferase